MKSFKENNLPKYFLLILGGFMILVPLVSTLLSSFKTTPDIMNNFFGLPNPFTLDNFKRLLADNIGHYFLNSAIISIVTVILVTSIIPMAAYALARKMSKGKAYGLMYLFLILGIFVPFQVIMIPITVMMSRIGLANMWGLVLLYLTYAIPQTLFLYVGFIN